MRMAPSRYPKDQGSATSRTRGSSSVTAFRKDLSRPNKRSGVRYEHAERSEGGRFGANSGHAALLRNLYGTALHRHLVRAAAGKGLESSIAPSKFRGAVLDILCIRQCNAVLASFQKRRIEFWSTPPMNRVTIVIPALASRSQTIDQRGN